MFITSSLFSDPEEHSGNKPVFGETQWYMSSSLMSMKNSSEHKEVSREWKCGSNPGPHDQSPKASRRADMQTRWCALRAHYHASFLLFIQSIGLLCTGTRMKAKKRPFKTKEISNLHKKWEDFGQDLADDQIIVVWFFESTQLSVSMKVYPHTNRTKSWAYLSAGKNERKYKGKINRIDCMKRLRRIHWFLSISRAETRRSPSLRKSLIMTHHSLRIARYQSKNANTKTTHRTVKRREATHRTVKWWELAGRFADGGGERR